MTLQGQAISIVLPSSPVVVFVGDNFKPSYPAGQGIIFGNRTSVYLYDEDYSMNITLDRSTNTLTMGDRYLNMDINVLALG